ncbi:hypothetical protein L914_06770, partial [Phytophthora nicotianae]
MILKGDVKSAFRRIAVAASLSAHFSGRLPVAKLSSIWPCWKTDFGWRKLLFASACWLRLVRSDKREKVFTLVHQLDSARTAVGYGGTQRVNAQGKNLQDASAATSSRYSCSSHAASARQKLDKLLGPLRHIGLCCRATRAFVQRLHYVWRSAPQYGMLRLTSDVVHDLMWIEYLLVQGVMNPVPTSIIAGTLPPDVNLFMDASNWGLAVLYPAIREYIRIQFDADELLAIQHASNSAVASFSINVREMLSAVLAVLVWGPHWWHLSSTTRRPLHVRCWIDNMSAVTWIDRHRTSNLLGQELLHVLSCAELEYGVHVSTEHLQGSSNYFADLGTRAWSDTDLRTWTNLTSSWCEQEVPRQFRKIYSARYRFSSGVRSQTLRDVTTSAPGSDGIVVGFRPHLQPQHELVLQGMRRLSPHRNHHGAVSVEMLKRIAAVADMSIAQHRVICGAAVLGFFFCLRGAEFLSSRGKRHVYCLQVQDVAIFDALGSKTDKYKTASSNGISTSRSLCKSDQAPVCPVFAALLLLRNAVKLNLPVDAPICSIGSQRTLSAETMSATLRKAAAHCNVDPKHISTHSVRTGGATELHNAGVDADTIRMRGRWASDAYQAYLRGAPASQLQLARRMGNC